MVAGVSCDLPGAVGTGFRPVFVVAAPCAGTMLLADEILRGGRAFSLKRGGRDELRSLLWQRGDGRTPYLDARAATADVVAAVHRIVGSRAREVARPVSTGDELVWLSTARANAWRIPFLNAAFPNAEFVYLFRDPRAHLMRMLEARRSRLVLATVAGTGGRRVPRTASGFDALAEVIHRAIDDDVAARWAFTTARILDDLAALPRERRCAVDFDALLHEDSRGSYALGRFGDTRPSTEADRALRDAWCRAEDETRPLAAIVDALLPRVRSITTRARSVLRDQAWVATGGSPRAALVSTCSPTRRRGFVAMGLAAGALVTVMAAPRLAQAATFTVTTATDSGAGSLRAALVSANAAAGPDTVVFAIPGGPQTITLTSGDLSVTDSVTMTGPGASLLTVSGNSASRIFAIDGSGPTPIAVAVTGVTLTGGNGVGTGGKDGEGGCVYAYDANLSMDSVVITGCTASQNGGGVYFDGYYGAGLSLTRSTITGNTATDSGGGVSIDDAYGAFYLATDLFSNDTAGLNGGAIDSNFTTGGSLVLLGSTVTGNLAGLTVGEPGNAGGVRVAYASSVTISDSTVSGNNAKPPDATTYIGYGGGVYLTGVATGTIGRSTITGNTAQVGAGVYLRSSGAKSPIQLQNDTLANNNPGLVPAGTAPYQGGGGLMALNATTVDIDSTTIVGNNAPTTGGGIFVSDTSTATLTDTIVANNVATTNGDVASVLGGTITATYSLIETPGTTTVGGGTGNITGQDPLLGPLALAAPGDSTAVMYPGATSPVINAGDPAYAPPPSVDQLQLPRVIDWVIDMGAVEVSAANGEACPNGRPTRCASGLCDAANVCVAAYTCHAQATITDCPVGNTPCANPAEPNGTSCFNPDLCTLSNTCQAGACVEGTAVVCPAAPDVCLLAGTCDPGTGTCSAPSNAPEGTSCNADSSACTAGDACHAGACIAGSDVVCTAPDECHLAGTCDTASGLCSVVPAADGTACSGGTCQAGACVPAGGVPDASTGVPDASTIDSGEDAASVADSGSADAGLGEDSSSGVEDAAVDTGVDSSTEPRVDSGMDATTAADSGRRADASNAEDASGSEGDAGAGHPAGGGCGCETVGADGKPTGPYSAWAGLALAGFVLARRKKGRSVGAG